MAKHNHVQKLTLAQQQLRLQQVYPNLIESIGIQRNELRCSLWLQPTAESIKYKVGIRLKEGHLPTAQLIEPKKMERFNGQKPHHLYNRCEDGKERLCVFHPGSQEWNDNMFLANAFVPWIITWLSAYEVWQITGIWVYPEVRSDKTKGKSGKSEFCAALK